MQVYGELYSSQLRHLTRLDNAVTPPLPQSKQARAWHSLMPAPLSSFFAGALNQTTWSEKKNKQCC